MKNAVALLPLMLLLISCLPSLDKSKLSFREIQIREDRPLGQEEVVTFEILKTKLLNDKCISCHKHEDMADEKKFQEYGIVIGDPFMSALYEKVRLGEMPVGRKLPDGTREPVDALTTAELDLLFNYIVNATAL